MVKEIGYLMAAEFATAHEQVDYTDDELREMVWYGFNGLEHRNMDLYNNHMGRSVYSPGDGRWELSQKVLELIKNDELIILVK